MDAKLYDKVEITMLHPEDLHEELEDPIKYQGIGTVIERAPIRWQPNKIYCYEYTIKISKTLKGDPDTPIHPSNTIICYKDEITQIL